MIEATRRVLVVLALASWLPACGPIQIPDPNPTPPAPTPTPTPTPPPVPIPDPQCQDGQTHSCWHFPPDSTMPLYACPVYDAQGGIVGVVNVTGGPAQCPAKPAPPVEPPVVPPDPPTPPTGSKNCDGAPGANTGQKLSSFGSAVNDVMHALTGCPIGSDCRLGDTPQQTFQRAVIDGLRARGVCAGQHSPNHTDEIAVATDQASVRESYHIFAGDDFSGPAPPGGTIRKVVWSPGAVREAYLSGSTPPPVDPAPPTAGACGAPLPPKVWTAATLPAGWGPEEIGKPRWQINCGPHNNVIDCTAQVAPQACAYCDSIGMGEMGGQIRCGCPVRNECPGLKCDERVACEAYLTGGTRLEAKEGSGATCSFVDGNPFMFHPSDGKCRLCSVGDGRVCGGWF